MSIVVNKTRLPVTEWQTESGSVVSVNDARKRYAKSLSVALEPIQDLHGYDAPWVGGAGKNLLDPTMVSVYGSGTTYGLTASWDSNTGAVTLTGTWTSSNTGGAWRLLSVPHSLREQYSVMGFSNSSNFFRFRWQADADIIVIESKNMVQNQLYTIVAYPIVYDGTAPTAWTPYENLCPISGHSSVTLNHAGTSQSDNPTSITVQLGQTVYGGTVDLVSGVGTLTMANIASYNGETIGEPWLSSMDKYVAGATPTTGAQVVYTLATPITFQLTPTQIAMLERYNTIWADEGDISVTYARIHS